MTRITLMLLMGLCTVAQETNHRIGYYKLINSANRFKLQTRVFHAGDYAVKGHIIPHNQQVNVFFSPAIKGYLNLTSRTSYPPLQIFNWYLFESAKVTPTQKPNKSNQVLIKEESDRSTAANKLDKLPTEEARPTSTEKNIDDNFKLIVIRKALEIPIAGKDFTNDLSPNETPQFLAKTPPENLDVTQKLPVMVRHDVGPFGHGPEELRYSESRKKEKFSRNRIHDNNKNNIKYSYNKLRIPHATFLKALHR